MKRLRPIALCVVLAALGATGLRAQWKTETYTLKAGWNAIYLQGDASYATPAELFKDSSTVLEVWRWNPNPDQIQFSASPAVPDATSSVWTIWNRNDPTEQQLTKMIGQTAYLVRCSGAAGTSTTVSIKQRPQPPAATWLIAGANLMGFPADSSTSSTATFTNYFASFPIAITSPAKIYKYVGGDLGLANPLQVVPGTDKIDHNTAYWFQAATVSNFTALVEYELPSTAGLAFGRTGTVLTMGVMNRSANVETLTISTLKSETAPTSQTGITDVVPITYRTFDSTTNSTTNTTTETAITGSLTVSVPANGRLNLQFGIDRSKLTGTASALYASLLRIKDTANLTDVFLPVTAQKATAAGLWVGEVQVSTVASHAASSPGSTTARPFPLRTIIHVDSSSTARLLSQAYVGTLAATGHALGVCTHEAALWAAAKADAFRVVSSQMPLDLAIPGTGAFTVGSTLLFTVTLPFDDVTNPFVHSYHPDHDNRDARFNPIGTSGVESYTVRRDCTFTFTAAPPDGSSIPGWGTTIFGGTYFEKMTGASRDELDLGGTFVLRRVSEVADLDLSNPAP